MRIPRHSILLSESHPSTLLQLQLEDGPFAPLIINEQGVLIDGYRRLGLMQQQEVEVSILPSNDIFYSALALNKRTRLWDETDCFLWIRWAEQLGITDANLPHPSFPENAFSASVPLLKALASRKLAYRQFLLLAGCPDRYRSGLLSLLTEKIRLNANETAVFFDMATDLISLQKMWSIDQLLALPVFSKILEDAGLNARQKGERLLVQMRLLRYPYYTKRSKEFSANWGLLGLNSLIRIKKSLFLERGLLEMAFSATSLKDLREKVSKLNRTLDSPVWQKIWDES